MSGHRLEFCAPGKIAVLGSLQALSGEGRCPKGEQAAEGWMRRQGPLGGTAPVVPANKVVSTLRTMSCCSEGGGACLEMQTDSRGRGGEDKQTDMLPVRRSYV